MLQRRRPVHKPWTRKNREILCLLKRSCERKHIAPIWSRIFRTRLAIEGFPNEIPATTLDAQWQELRGGGTGYEIFAHISSASQNLVEREYRAHLDEIRRAIQDLSLGIAFRITKRCEPIGSHAPQRRPARRTVPFISDLVSSNESALSRADKGEQFGLQQFAYQESPYFTDTRLLTMAETSVAHSRNDTEKPVPPCLRVGTDLKGNTTQSHPLLLFRATPSINKFISRKFANHQSAIPPPSTFGSRQFKDIVWPHLERDKCYPSPFISLAQNPRNAVRRVELARSEEVEKKMFLAIFAFNELQADAETHFGDGAGPYLVRSLFTTKEISELPDGYKGAGEWLIYGAINCEPVVVLDSATAITLAKALRRFKAGDAAATLKIRESIRCIPMRWRETVAYNFLHHYCGRAQLPKIGSEPYRLLMKTILHVSQDSLNDLIAFCGRPSGEDVEDGLTVVHSSLNSDTGSDEEAEIQEEPNNPKSIRVNVPLRAGLNSGQIINSLNSIAAKMTKAPSTQDSRFQRADLTPMWSTDSEPENIPSKPVKRDRQYAKIAKAELLRQVDIFSGDWDAIENDLQTSFAEVCPSASRKIRCPLRALPNVPDAIPSIEDDSHIDTFTAELLRSAHESSPVLVPTRTSQQAVRQQNGTSTIVPTALSSTSSASSSFVDLADHLATESPTKTTQKPSVTIRKRQVFSDDSDDDIVITGSGKRIRLALRSLSVQEVDRTDSDEDYVSASEVL